MGGGYPQCTRVDQLIGDKLIPPLMWVKLGLGVWIPLRKMKKRQEASHDYHAYSPKKTKISPENQWLEVEKMTFPFEMVPFNWGHSFIFGGGGGMKMKGI